MLLLPAQREFQTHIKSPSVPSRLRQRVVRNALLLYAMFCVLFSVFDSSAAVCRVCATADLQDTSRLSVKDAADLLQIAVNCSSQDTATALFESMARSQRTLDFKLLEPAAVRRILVTAALRQHASVIETLAMQAGVEQIVDPATFEAVLSHLMTQRHEDVCAWLLDTCATAAATLSSDAVARLILQALESGPKCQQHGSLVLKLICMPAAAQMSSSDMARIIQSIGWGRWCGAC